MIKIDTSEFEKLGFIYDPDIEYDIITFYKEVKIKGKTFEINVCFYTDEKTYTLFLIEELDNKTFKVGSPRIDILTHKAINSALISLGWNNENHN
jgi:hypothetical protein